MKIPIVSERDRPLGLLELIAIALGGMVGGGIFSILGISVQEVGNAAPIAIFVGGLLASLAAYSYVQLALLYEDEGATYSFFKKTFPDSPFSAALIGWFIAFGYISTLALYAFTFASYFCGALAIDDEPLVRDAVAGLIILAFAIVNLVSVKGMGKLEDVMVYSKIVLLLFVSGLLAGKGQARNFLPLLDEQSSPIGILMIASLTFVAYEGFQLVIHAYNEVDSPAKNIPRAIYGATIIATLLYVVLALGALATIPKAAIIADKEFALAAGASDILGSLGYFLVLFGALLATSSAISGTLFGASRLMAVIADDGHFPKALRLRIKGHVPKNAIWTMSGLAYVLILCGGLQLILEFGSVTFIIVSFLMAFANFRKRKETNSSIVITVTAMVCLFTAGTLLIVFEFTHSPKQLFSIVVVYGLLLVFAFVSTQWRKRLVNPERGVQ